ncbi:MAG: YbaB/EbfC family nucleoid-associated protein, partial [Winogradskyella sp.]
MFGDMMGMMGKLKEAQKKVEETKERLHSVLIDEASSDNKLKVTITANRTLKSIVIDDA